MCELEKAKEFMAGIMKSWKELRPEVSSELLLNRMHFIEVLLMYVEHMTS